MSERPSRKAKNGVSMTLKGIAAHRFLHAFDPTFPLHPDDPNLRQSSVANVVVTHPDREGKGESDDFRHHRLRLRPVRPRRGF